MKMYMSRRVTCDVVSCLTIGNLRNIREIVVCLKVTINEMKRKVVEVVIRSLNYVCTIRFSDQLIL